jgi:hypothetical protein
MRQMLKLPIEKREDDDDDDDQEDVHEQFDRRAVLIFVETFQREKNTSGKKTVNDVEASHDDGPAVKGISYDGFSESTYRAIRSRVTREVSLLKSAM